MEGGTYFDDGLLVDEDWLWWAGARDRGLGLGQLLVQIGKLVRCVCTVLRCSHETLSYGKVAG